MAIIRGDLFRNYFTPDLQIEISDCFGLLPHPISEVSNTQKRSSTRPIPRYLFLKSGKEHNKQKTTPPNHQCYQILVRNRKNSPYFVLFKYNYYYYQMATLFRPKGRRNPYQIANYKRDPFDQAD